MKQDTCEDSGSGERREFVDIEIEAIDVSQNDRCLDKDSVNFIALKESIREQGLIQMPIVTPQSGMEKPYMCVAGHRRLEALKDLNIKTCVCLVMTFSNPEQIKITRLTENIIRENLKPLEMAVALSNLKSQLKLSSNGLARLLNKDRAYLSRIIRIASWPEDIKKMISGSDLRIRHLFLLAVKNLPEDQLRTQIRGLIETRQQITHNPRIKEARHSKKREEYFIRLKTPQEVRIEILNFLRENKIRGWYEDIDFSVMTLSMHAEPTG